MIKSYVRADTQSKPCRVASAFTINAFFRLSLAVSFH